MELKWWRANANEEPARWRADAKEASIEDWPSAEAPAEDWQSAETGAETLAAAEEQLKHEADRAREVLAKRMERDLPDRVISQDGLGEYEEAEMRFQLMGMNFPKWVHQSMEGRAAIEASFLDEEAELRFQLMGMNVPKWMYKSVEGRAAIEPSFREAELAVEAKCRVGYGA